MNIMWQNGRFAPEGPAFLPNDRIRIGDGVFDTMLAIDGAVVRANEHFKRLLAHAALLRIKTPWNIQELEATSKALLDQNKQRAGRFVINTIITRGATERGLQISETAPTQILMISSPAPTEFADIHAIVATQVRRNEGSPLSRIKSCNYGDNILALAEAHEKNANEAILLNNKGFITCASSSNIYIVQNGTLYTPPLADGAMDGITRKILIQKKGVREKSLPSEALFKNEGIYLSSTVRGIVPVKRLDGRNLPKPSLQIDKEFHLN